MFNYKFKSWFLELPREMNIGLEKSEVWFIGDKITVKQTKTFGLSNQVWNGKFGVAPSLQLLYKASSKLRRRNVKTAFPLWKHIECFPSTLRRSDLKTQPTITSHFGFVFEENLGREILSLSWCHRFRKALFAKCFPSTLRRKAGVFKFLRFEKRFPKARFSWRISVNGGPNRRIKAAF